MRNKTSQDTEYNTDRGNDTSLNESNPSIGKHVPHMRKIGLIVAAVSLTFVVALFSFQAMATTQGTRLQRAAEQISVNVPGPSAPSGAAAAQVVQYRDSTEVTFYNSRGTAIESRVEDERNLGIHAPGDTLPINSFDENGNLVRTEETITRITDGKGNDVLDSIVRWYGDPDVIRSLGGTPTIVGSPPGGRR